MSDLQVGHETDQEHGMHSRDLPGMLAGVAENRFEVSLLQDQDQRQVSGVRPLMMC
jgi:hypothetical protein